MALCEKQGVFNREKSLCRIETGELGDRAVRVLDHDADVERDLRARPERRVREEGVRGVQPRVVRARVPSVAGAVAAVQQPRAREAVARRGE